MDLLKSELISGGIINDKNILKGTADISSLQFANEVLQEHCDKIREKFSKLVTERGSTKIKVRNGDLPEVTNGRQSYVDERDFRTIMDELSSRMRKRTFYSVKIDNEKFITETAAILNNEFADKSITLNYDLGIGKIVVEKDKKFGVHGGLTDQVREDADEILPKSDYEVVNFIMYHTNLPRLAIVRILQLFTRRDLLNSQDWLDRVTYRIAELFTEAKGKSISHYNIIEGYEFGQDIIFEADLIDPVEFEETKKRYYTTDRAKRRAIHKYYKMDGDGGEYAFAQSLENNPHVLLWTKLKKGRFVIDTPYGDYTPDWAVVIKKDDKPQLYFIVETKINKTWEMLYPDEKAKIDCGRAHFQAVCGIDKFDWVDSFIGETKDSFIHKFGV